MHLSPVSMPLDRGLLVALRPPNVMRMAHRTDDRSPASIEADHHGEASAYTARRTAACPLLVVSTPCLMRSRSTPRNPVTGTSSARSTPFLGASRTARFARRRSLRPDRGAAHQVARHSGRGRGHDPAGTLERAAGGLRPVRGLHFPLRPRGIATFFADPEVWGSGIAMLLLMAVLDRVREPGTTTCICGRSGTPPKRAASTPRMASPRPAGPTTTTSTMVPRWP